jgi:hypothetical protein
MPATFEFISRTVGDKNSVGVKATNRRSDVKALQQLLMAAGETVEGGDDGGWGQKTGDALESFQRKHARQGLTPKRFVEPGDYVLLLLAWRANILVPMPGHAGMAGVLAMHKWFVDNLIKYNSGAENGAGNRVTYGLEGDTRYGVQRTSAKWLKGPVEMDCTTYVNLMLAIYGSGHIHSAPYDGLCPFGGTSATHCGRDRYQLPLIRRSVTDKAGKASPVNYFATAEQITAATQSDPSGLYVIEVALGGSGYVKHMGLLHNGTVYECTTSNPAQPASAGALKTS